MSVNHTHDFDILSVLADKHSFTEQKTADGIPTIWDNSSFEQGEYLAGQKSLYVGRAITDEMIKEAQNELGYQLPQSYLQFLKIQNGGIIHEHLIITDEPNDLYGDYLSITNIAGIDKQAKRRSIYYGKILIERGFVDIGIYVCNLLTDHDWLIMDYRECGKNGEPQISHICVDGDEPHIQIIAKDFKTFIENLKNANDFEYDDDECVYVIS